MAERIDLTETQMLVALPLDLGNGTSMPIWSLPDYPTLFAWDDKQGTSVVADLRETDRGRMLFATIGNPYRSLTDEEVDRIERALYAEGTRVERTRSLHTTKRVTTFLVTLEEVKQCERTTPSQDHRGVHARGGHLLHA